MRPHASADVRYCSFDLLCVDDDDLRPLPLLARKEQLRSLVCSVDHRLVYVDHVQERGEELLAGARALRLEGIVGRERSRRTSQGGAATGAR